MATCSLLTFATVPLFSIDNSPLVYFSVQLGRIASYTARGNVYSALFYYAD